MKITLRKVKSVAIGEKYNADFFIPITLPHNRSAVSVSVIGNAFSICKKYSIDYKDYDEADFSIYLKRKVVLVDKEIIFIFVPSTQSSNSNSISKYCERICELIEFKDYLHFTHFGYLKTSFPSAQIKKILSIFLDKEDFECEVCWDIDEKYFKEMQDVLVECLGEKNKDINFDSYDADVFVWSKEYDTWRESRSEVRKKRELSHNMRISNEYKASVEQLARFKQSDKKYDVDTFEDELIEPSKNKIECMYKFYLLTYDSNFSLAKKRNIMTAVLSYELWAWRVVGISPNAVKAIAKNNFNLPIGLQRDHWKKTRKDTFDKIFKSKFTLDDWWKEVWENDVTLLMTKDEHHNKLITENDCFEVDYKQGYFRNKAGPGMHFKKSFEGEFVKSLIP